MVGDGTDITTETGGSSMIALEVVVAVVLGNDSLQSNFISAKDIDCSRTFDSSRIRDVIAGAPSRITIQVYTNLS